MTFRKIKDPDATLDYQMDWSDWLAESDLIATSEWIVPAALAVVSESQSENTATVLLSGGLTGQTYVVVNRIVTDAGLTDDRSIEFLILDR
ncbi:MAG: hypothetical protein AAGI88_09155 [Pseudomonadota bacterium]